MFEVSSYGTHELRQTILDDAYAVRDEAGKRANRLAAQIATAQKKIAKLAAQKAELEAIYEAAWNQVRKEQEAQTP